MTSVYCRYAAHNMKKLPWIAAAMFFATVALGARAAEPFKITVDDVAAAGVAGAILVTPETSRFRPPVTYFRTEEKLSAANAKKDCADCADLVAIHVAEVSNTPSWVATPQLQFMRFGTRLQLRAYIAETKRVVIVTGPSEAMVRKISQSLVAKFSR